MRVKEEIEGKAGQRPALSWRNTLNILCCVVVLLPPALAVAGIHCYGINIPYQDDWGTLKPVLESYAGTLSFNSLWVQHNEHRLLIVKIITVLLARVTRYNLVADLYCSLSFEFLALILIWRTLAITLRADSILARPLLICASLLLFSAVSWENWTMTVASLQFFGGVFWATASVWALAEWPGRWRGVLVASAAAFLGICTSGLGFPLLIVVLLGILAQGLERRKIRWAQVAFLPAWSGAFLAFYFKGYDSMGHSVVSLFGRGGLHAIAYFFAYLGSPFVCRGFVGLELTSAIGFAGVAWFSIFLWLILRHLPELRRSAAPWILLGVFAILNAALTSFARLEFPLPQATSSRYRSIAMLLWLPLLVISSLLARRIPRPGSLCRPVRLASGVVAAVSILLYVVCYGWGVAHMRTHHVMMRQTLPSLLNYRSAPDEELRYLFPDPYLVRAESELLEKYRLGPFAGISGEGTN